jgi:signal transduction histidine kinase
MLTIAGTGTGMTAPVLRKIFDAFFSTKGIDGTGLGLWISNGIMERHQGCLNVRSSARRKGQAKPCLCSFYLYEVPAN